MKVNEYECNRCGAVVTTLVSRCPACGLSIYPEETEQNEVETVEINQAELKSRRDASAIQETGTSLILRLPASRKIDWLEIVKGVFFVVVILGLLVAPLLIVPEHIIWGVLLGIAVMIPAGYHWLYLLAGEEELEVERESIQVRYGIWLWKRSQKYPANAVNDLRCSATRYQHRTQSFGSIRPIWTTRLDTRTSAIVCDYHGQAISLLGWIEKPLARHFIALIKRRFPNYNG